MELKVGKTYITNNHPEIDSDLHNKRFMVISSEKIQDTQIYLLKFDHCEKQRMINEVNVSKYITESIEPLRHLKLHKI
ncbi:MAG: hypothetical protein ACK5OW_01545 [bacterium]|jgi:hypothetical protein